MRWLRDSTRLTRYDAYFFFFFFLVHIQSYLASRARSGMSLGITSMRCLIPYAFIVISLSFLTSVSVQFLSSSVFLLFSVSILAFLLYTPVLAVY